MATAERNPATAPLFIVNPLTGERMDNLFSTHPATENRIAALQAMTGSGGAGTHLSGFAETAAAQPRAPAGGLAAGPWSRAGARVRRGPWG